MHKGKMIADLGDLGCGCNEDTCCCPFCHGVEGASGCICHCYNSSLLYSPCVTDDEGMPTDEHTCYYEIEDTEGNSCYTPHCGECDVCQGSHQKLITCFCGDANSGYCETIPPPPTGEEEECEDFIECSQCCNPACCGCQAPEIQEEPCCTTCADCMSHNEDPCQSSCHQLPLCNPGECSSSDPPPCFPQSPPPFLSHPSVPCPSSPTEQCPSSLSEQFPCPPNSQLPIHLPGWCGVGQTPCQETETGQQCDRSRSRSRRAKLAKTPINTNIASPQRLRTNSRIKSKK